MSGVSAKSTGEGGPGAGARRRFNGPFSSSRRRSRVRAMPTDVALLDSVARLALFADLDRVELEQLVPVLEEVSFPEGRWILRRGDENVGLHVIVDGEVGVVLEEEELAVLSKGSFFGEISALLREPTVADIIARTNVRCLFVPAADVEGFLLASPRVMFRMLQTEARRVRTTDERHI
jgi:CRP-like cAMP-binding protein